MHGQKNIKLWIEIDVLKLGVTVTETIFHETRASSTNFRKKLLHKNFMKINSLAADARSQRENEGVLRADVQKGVPSTESFLFISSLFNPLGPEFPFKF